MYSSFQQEGNPDPHWRKLDSRFRGNDDDFKLSASQLSGPLSRPTQNGSTSKRMVVLEVSQILKLAEAFLNFRVLQPLHAIQAEILDVERRHHRTVDHRFA